MVETRAEARITTALVPLGVDDFGKTMHWNTYAWGFRTDQLYIAPDGSRYSDNEHRLFEQLQAGHLFGLEFGRRSVTDFPDWQLGYGAMSARIASGGFSV